MKFRQEVSFYNDEYIVSVLRTQDTKFDVLQGYVGAIITETELEQLRNGDGTMYSRLASAELTIDGLNRTYQEVRSDYTATNNNLNTLSTRVTQISESVDGVIMDVSDIQIQANETDTRVSNLSLTVDGFSTRISQAKTEAISTANSATDSKLANYTRTSELTSYINQQTGKISLGVIANSSTLATKTYADGKATDAQTAAKNYTDTQLTSYTKTSQLTVDLDGIRTSVTEAKTEAISTANAATDSKLKDYTKTTSLMSYINQQTGKIELGVIKNSSTLATKTYADGVGTTATNTAKSYADNVGTSATNNAKAYTDTQLKSYTKTSQLTVDLDGIRTSVAEAKTEAITEANAATDNKLASYTKTTNLMSYINQQSGSINLGVIKNSSTLATKTYADGVGTTATNTAKSYADNVGTSATNNAKAYTDTQLKSYTKTSQLTVDLDGIRTSVAEAKTEAITEANAATDSKLKDYTKTTSLMSYINQQSGSINLGVIKNSSTLATKTYADGVGTTATNTAKTYADGVGTTATNTAKTYADGVGTAATNTAKAYTDNQLKSYTKTSQLTVDLDGIRTSVTEAKEEAVAEANAATDTKLANYTTTANLVSYINQQSGSINLGVIKNSSTLATKSYADQAEADAIATSTTNLNNALKSYTKTADLTISIDGIATKVTSANIDLAGTKNAAVSAANAATDTKLANYTTTANLVSYINQQSGKINLGVIKNSSTLATKTYADQAEADAIATSTTNLNNALKSYTKTADLTISIDGIATKVTSANIDLAGTKNAAVSAANAATDTKLANYTTTVNLVSYINQQADSINLSVVKNSSTLATKTYADSKATSAESAAKSYTNTKTTAASITAAINESGSSIKLNANKINMDADTLALWGKDIRMTSSTIAWDSDYSTLTRTGALTVRTFTQEVGQFKVTTNNSVSFLLFSNDSGYKKTDGSLPQYGRYLRLSSDGLYGGYNTTSKVIINPGTPTIKVLNGSVTHTTMSTTAFEVYDGDTKTSYMSKNRIYTTGTKSRKVETENFGNKLLYCYETPSPLFGDVGEGVIGEDGKCYVPLDVVFSETIQTSQYQVFLQAYGEGMAYVSKRDKGYFVVEGSPGLAFGWELKAKQADFTQLRLEDPETLYDPPATEDYAEMAMKHIEELTKERMVI